MRIKKVSQTTSTQAQVVDGYSTSTTDSYSCNYVNNNSQDIYSTNEVKTNKVWIDGKPVYRTVYTGNLSDGAKAHGLSNFEIRNIEGCFKNTRTNNYFKIPSVRPNYSNYEIGIYTTDTNIEFDIGTAVDTQYIAYEVILEYTKTAD